MIWHAFVVIDNMWYKTTNGLLQVNCDVQPNTDVSGIGVRDAFYLQSALAVLLTLFKSTTSEILLSNISLLGTSFALIFSAYVDPTIDIPHAIIASQLAYMLWWCRYPFASFGGSPQSMEDARTRWALWIIERVVNCVLKSFNYHLWYFIRTLQQNETECLDGFGYWALMRSVNLKVSTSLSTFAYVWCILDIVSEGLGVFTTMARIYIERFRIRGTY